MMIKSCQRKPALGTFPHPLSRSSNRDNDRLSRQQLVRNYRNPARRLFLERVQPNTSAGNGAFTSEDPCTSSRAISRVPATTRRRPAFDNVCRNNFYISTVEEFNARFSRRCPYGRPKTCNICFAVEANSAFVPCGHACSCIDCTKSVVGRNRRTTRDDDEVRFCLLCRGVVWWVLKVYDA